MCKVCFHVASVHSILTWKHIYLPLVFFSSTKQAICTGKHELWYGSFFNILKYRIEIIQDYINLYYIRKSMYYLSVREKHLW